MRETGGSCQVAGTLGYVSQQAWIFSGTVRDNILLGAQYEADWFSQVVEVCALTRDFQLLEAGDLTEVGERGITLSGGQKQRISLARALYSRYFTLYSVLCNLYFVLCALYSVLSTQYPVPCTRNSVSCTLYPVIRTLYSVLGTQYSVLRTLSSGEYTPVPVLLT